MGAGAVADAAANGGNHQSVQRIRIPGAEEIFHVCPCPLHSLADFPHEGILANAGAALENHEIVGRFRIHDLREEILKAVSAVGT